MAGPFLTSFLLLCLYLNLTFGLPASSSGHDFVVRDTSLEPQAAGGYNNIAYFVNW